MVGKKQLASLGDVVDEFILSVITVKCSLRVEITRAWSRCAGDTSDV